MTGEGLSALKRHLSEVKSALLAYSGGVDSTLLASVAHEVLGDRLLAATARGSIYPSREIRRAAEMAAKIGLRHRFVDVDPLGTDGVRGNPPDRCYHCKWTIFSRLREIAAAEGLDAVLDGQNADDAGDYRPGARAAAELGVISPLRDAGLTKTEIRDISRRLDLDTWEDPALACLATRVPYGRELTPELLARIDAAEDALIAAGFRQVRVRDLATGARIEVPLDDVPRLSGGLLESLTVQLKELGYASVEVDPRGYRSGSMDEAL